MPGRSSGLLAAILVRVRLRRGHWVYLVVAVGSEIDCAASQCDPLDPIVLDGDRRLDTVLAALGAGAFRTGGDPNESSHVLAMISLGACPIGRIRPHDEVAYAILVEPAEAVLVLESPRLQAPTPRARCLRYQHVVGSHWSALCS
jgi:hypothetical protein